MHGGVGGECVDPDLIDGEAQVVDWQASRMRGFFLPERKPFMENLKMPRWPDEASAEAALKWARYKSSWPGLEFSSPLARRAHYGTYEALLNYNGNKQDVGGIPFRVRYANDILNRAWASYGDWQK